MQSNPWPETLTKGSTEGMAGFAFPTLLPLHFRAELVGSVAHLATSETVGLGK